MVNDLISRQDAIDALDEQITQCDKALGSFDISMKDEYAVKVERASLKAYRETLNVLPSAQPEPKWIPCSERPPEVENNVAKRVIVTTSWNMVCEAHYCVDHWEMNDIDYKLSSVIAWMPLPEPFVYERNEKSL